VSAAVDPRITRILDEVDPAGTGADGALFTAPQLAALAAIPSSDDQLMEMVADASLAPARRFVAAEALSEGPWSGWRPSPHDRGVVAGALADAMATDRSHNRWGLPGTFVGPFGRRLMSLGAEADDALRAYLDDARPLAIEGSEAATINAGAGYRVGDLAAWLRASAGHR
jgi:hypothetical protein